MFRDDIHAQASELRADLRARWSAGQGSGCLRMPNHLSERNGAILHHAHAADQNVGQMIRLVWNPSVTAGHAGDHPSFSKASIDVGDHRGREMQPARDRFAQLSVHS